MDRMRRQVLRQMASLATLAGATAVGAGCANDVFAASDSSSSAGPLTVVDLGNYRRGRTGALPKIVRTPEQLMADKLVMPYQRANVIGVRPMSSYRYAPGVYAEVGLQPSMGAGGERQEIGVETDATADWLMGGSPTNMLIQAEAHGSVPVHFIAPDGRIVDAIKYPSATTDYRGPGRGQKPFFDASGTPIAPEWAHYPSLDYVAYLATGDRYYLEELQFAATFMIINAPPEYRGRNKARINDIQHRGLAWGLREVAKAYLATPEQVTSPLLPKSYWKSVLENIRADMETKWLKNNSPLVKGTGIYPSREPFDGCIAPWQHDYISMVLGWMVYTGRFPEWRPLYEFQVRQAIVRASGPMRSQAIGYELKSNGATDWTGVLRLNDMGKPTGDNNFPPNVKKQSPHYAGLLRASLALAVKNGIGAAQEPYAYAHAQARRVGLISLRHAV